MFSFKTLYKCNDIVQEKQHTIHKHYMVLNFWWGAPVKVCADKCAPSETNKIIDQFQHVKTMHPVHTAPSTDCFDWRQ
jgi:hypothetical protein